MSTPPTINTKADRDRIRQRASGNRALIQAVRRLLKEYREGRAASAVLADVERLLSGEARR